MKKILELNQIYFIPIGFISMAIAGIWMGESEEKNNISKFYDSY